ncbi:LOW QUALITY PROTEIN: hypothetical protein BRADI_2g00930v3 [Brachypodium distachyon]|uniref:Pectinesterase inhibitor domain-containing protein n=1 Tax=Brachypodium distachyon TaxID=15368 RepID=A0A0Q3QLK5_BRADI|nr:LOW QUALITY PROTEIN: hypothetical protein BRADI_2g00930v3 [Brachypodium distachyon]
MAILLFLLAGLISSTCQKTKNATQCVSVLDAADPDTKDLAANERDLAGIALNSPSTRLDATLHACGGAYFDAANTLRIDALDSMNESDFLGASTRLVESCKGAGELCDGSFPASGLGPAPEVMAAVDRNMTQRCAVLLDLLGLLFVPPHPPAA